MSIRKKISAVTPILVLFTFLLIGFLTDIWHPTWLVFLLIPIVEILCSRYTNFKNKIISITPLISTAAFLVLGICFDLWHPGWLVFLLIPIVPIILGIKKIHFTVGLAITIIYLVIGFVWKLWHPGWLIFMLIPVFEILFKKEDKKHFNFDFLKNFKAEKDNNDKDDTWTINE